MKHKVVLLLTACVFPNGMSNTMLQDSNIRKQQYISALNFYLENTDLPIVFCENTLCDFSDIYSKEIKSNRLEYITFLGNDYDNGKGKGYGEALIIEHAIKYSKFLQYSDYLIKVTGRVRITNINEICNSVLFHFSNIFRYCFAHNGINTVVFVSPVNVISKILAGHKEEISDESYSTILEGVVAKYVIQDKSVRLIPFARYPQINGIQGGTNTAYLIPDRHIYILDNIYFMYRICRQRHEIFQMTFLYIAYIFFLLWFKAIRKI